MVLERGYVAWHISLLVGMSNLLHMVVSDNDIEMSSWLAFKQIPVLKKYVQLMKKKRKKDGIR